MKRFLFWLYLLIKRQVKNPMVLTTLILLPLITAIVSNIPQLNKSDKPKVGIVLADNDSLAKNTAEALVNGDYGVEFYMADSIEALISDIYDNDAECGYVINNNLKNKLDTKAFDDCFTNYTRKSQFISSMANEIVFSEMFRYYALDVAVNYIQSKEEFEPYYSKCEESIRKSYDNYLNSGDTFNVEVKMLSGENDKETTFIEEKSAGFPLKAILMILVYIAGLFGGVSYFTDKENGTFATLSKGYKIIGLPLYAFIESSLFATSVTITLIITGDYYGGAFTILKNIISMIVYVLAITLFTWAMGVLIRNSRGMVAIIPVLLILSIVLCPVFINVVSYLPWTRLIQKMLLPYYMI